MKLDFIELLYGSVRRNSPEPSSAINTNINMVSVSAERDRLVVDFEFTATYAPDGSLLVIGGRARFSGEDAAKCRDEWDATKKITGASGELILNAINYNASLNAVLLARVFNLVPPVVIATLTFGQAPPVKASIQRTGKAEKTPAKKG